MTYDPIRAQRVEAVRPGYDAADHALFALRTVEEAHALAEAEAQAAIAAVEAQEAEVRKTKATDYVAREIAIAPLRALIPARDRAVARLADLQVQLEQRKGQLAGGISKRRREIAGHRDWIVELAEELDRQEARLDEFAGRYLPAAQAAEA